MMPLPHAIMHRAAKPVLRSTRQAGASIASGTLKPTLANCPLDKGVLAIRTDIQANSLKPRKGIDERANAGRDDLCRSGATCFQCRSGFGWFVGAQKRKPGLVAFKCLKLHGTGAEKRSVSVPNFRADINKG